eukprot:gene2808-biopygen2557
MGSGVTCVDVSDCGTRLFTGSSDGTVRVWDVAEGGELLVCEGHCNTVCSVRASPSGATVFSGSSEGTIKVWDTSTGDEVRSLDCLTGYGGVIVA